MCGIAGTLGIDPNLALPAAERMRAALRHRGPDDQGTQVIERDGGEAPVVLAHTRLAIIDLSASGHQPMRDRPLDPALSPNWITYNGEIYNYRSFWPELERAGFPCRTRSDTEVLLNLYRAYGPDAVERLEGMFAFCVVDTAQGMAWLCRDRLGIKPLYLFRPPGGGLMFASEVRALLAAGNDLVSSRLNRSALESFLAQGAVMSEAALVEGVELLPPGGSLIVDLDGRKIRSTRYFSLAFGRAGQPPQPAPPERAAGKAGAIPEVARYRSELVEDLGRALRHSISGLLLADVPVGLFLSSGVDSTALALLASEVASEPLKTLAVGFDAQAFDETRVAGDTARALGTDHRRLELSGAHVLRDFDAVLAAVDQPTVDGFNTYFVSRAAREAGLTVALSGLGGDELFGGYATFRDVPRALVVSRAARRLRPPEKTLGSFTRFVGRLGRNAGARARALGKLSESLHRRASAVDLYLLRRELIPRETRRSLHALPIESDPHSGIELGVLEALRAGHDGGDTLDQVAFLELSSYMRHMLLRDADVFSMAHGLEVRVPLLEHPVVAQAARARGAWRRPDPRPKPLLLDAVGTRFPREVLAGKRGFTFPWQVWLEGPLRERARAAVESSRLTELGLERSAARSLFTRFTKGDRSVSPLELLALIVLDASSQTLRLSA